MKALLQREIVRHFPRPTKLGQSVGSVPPTVAADHNRIHKEGGIDVSVRRIRLVDATHINLIWTPTQSQWQAVGVIRQPWIGREVAVRGSRAVDAERPAARVIAYVLNRPAAQNEVRGSVSVRAKTTAMAKRQLVLRTDLKYVSPICI